MMRKGGIIGILCLVIALPVTVSGQLNPFGSSYFQNQYLMNPAMAGAQGGLNVNLGVRQQWSNIPGTPQTQSVTADYGNTVKKIGLGLSIDNDKAGLRVRTRVMGTFAYHLPLSGEMNRLSFGLSLGYMDDRIENSEIRGDAGDQSVGRYNQRSVYVDGDAGASFTTKWFTLQAAVPNIKNFLKRDQAELGVDRATFFASTSCKLELPGVLDGLTAEPKICYRGVHGYNNIFDAGANLNFANKRMHLLGMYHSTQSATFGMGVVFKWATITGLYITETAALRSYANGTFELGLKVKAL